MLIEVSNTLSVNNPTKELMAWCKKNLVIANVLTPNTRDESDYSPDEIRERYIAADKDKRLSQGGEDEDSSND